MEALGELIAAPITQRHQLRTWIKQVLDIDVPDIPVCACHSAPMDYLWQAFHEPARDLVIWAPRGGGKTRLGAAVTLADLIHKPGCKIRILGGSLDQSLRMWEHLWPDVSRLIEDRLIQGEAKAHRIQLANGSSAAVLSQSQRAVRGLRVQKLRCDEVELFDPEVWEAAQLATRSRRPVEGSQPAVAGVVEALSTLHRPAGLMSRIVEEAQAGGIAVIKWCLLEVLERCPTDRSCAHCPLAEECGGAAKDRCAGFFAIDDAIAMKRRVSRETWESEMLCRRPGRRGAVFPHFDPAIHVREMDLPGQLWLGIDFGFFSPFVCLWIMRSEDGSSYVLDEYVQDGRIVAEHIQEIGRRPWGGARRMACDPAGSARNEQTAESNVRIFSRHGYTVHRKKSHIADGIEMIRAALRPGHGEPGLFVHPRCKRLIAALRGYRYGGHGGELPLKDGTHDHLIDALRYYFVNANGCGKVEERGY